MTQSLNQIFFCKKAQEKTVATLPLAIDNKIKGSFAVENVTKLANFVHMVTTDKALNPESVKLFTLAGALVKAQSRE